MRKKVNFFRKGKRNFAFGLSATMAFGLAATNFLPANLPVIHAAEYDLYEDFNSYDDVSKLLGGQFGGPTLSLEGNGIDNSLALNVTNRTQNYFGYSYDVSKYKGNTIKLSAMISAFEAGEEDENRLAATIKMSKSGADDDYQAVASVNITGSGFGSLEGTYEIPSDVDSAVIYFEAPEEVSYILDDVSIEVDGEYTDPSTTTSYADISQYEVLKDLYSDYFKLGVACEAISNWNNQLSEIGNADKEALILKEFNSITFGNELKPDYNMGYNSAEATDDNLPFVINPAAKEMLDFAKANGISVRGHVLVWHSQNPDAIFCENYAPVYVEGSDSVLDESCLVSREVMLKRLESYINNVMDYMYSNGYAETIYAWDVVNEAIEPGSNEYNLRNSYWYKTIGPDFVYYAFKYAREATNRCASEYGVNFTPDLFYNDYNEYQESKCDAIINILTADINGHNIVGEGLIDGVGMQSHVADSTNIDSFITALRRYDKAVGQVHITELDVAETSSGVNADYYQAAFYQEFFKRLVEEVENGVNLTSVTIWGLTDDNSWKVESSPLIFRGDLSKKMAFDGIVNAVTGDELPEPAYVAPDFSDYFADFEEDVDGFGSRGDGTASVQSDVVFDGESALIYEGRTATWNGASFDVSRFAGQTIDVSAWVKCSDSTVKLSADIDNVWPNIASVDTTNGDWVQIKGRYSIPKDLNSLKLYFESDGTADIYIDACKVKLVGLDEGFEEASNIATARGVGHMPVVTVTESDKKSGDRSLKVTRAAQEATVKFDISKYIGQTVNISAYVKTSDSEIKLGLDGDNPAVLGNVTSNGDWTLVTATTTIPNSLTSANIFIETNGNKDMFIDDFNVELADFDDDLEDGITNFSTRWGGAGTLEEIDDNGGHAVKLTDKDETYYGIVFDLTPYIGSEIEVSCDVKTDDDEIKISGDIDNVWPNYLTTSSTPGKYKRIGTIIRVPSDLSSLRAYIETSGTSDIYVDNFSIRRVKVDDEYKVTFDAKAAVNQKLTKLFTKGYLITEAQLELGEGKAIDGWFTDKKFTKEWNFGADKLSGNTTLYAKADGVSVDDGDEEDNNKENGKEDSEGNTGNVTENTTEDTDEENMGAPVIKTQPHDVYAQEGATANFAVVATGTDIKYQWMIDKNDGKGYQNIEGAVESNYQLKNVKLSDDGVKYVCVVSNVDGSVTTKEATLYVSAKLIEYEVLEGKNGSFDINSANDYIIRVDCDLIKFVNVTVDGEILDKSYYTVKNGSTIVDFNKYYMRSLDMGEHDIRVNFNDGYAIAKVKVFDGTKADESNGNDDSSSENVSTEVTTENNNGSSNGDSSNGGSSNNGQTTTESGNNQTTTQSNNSNSNNNDTNVKTGDMTPIGILATGLLVAGAGLAIIVSKKRKYNEE